MNLPMTLTAPVRVEMYKAASKNGCRNEDMESGDGMGRRKKSSR